MGSFVAASLVGLVIAVALLTGRTGATDSYYAVYKNVEGIKFGTQIMFEGYQIGQVEAIKPLIDEKKIRFKVVFEVQEGWKIPGDSTAQIVSSGLLAPVVLSIRAGASQTPLKPGDMVPSKESANIFAVISEVAGEVSELSNSSLRPLLASVNQAVKTFETILGADGKALVSEIRGVIEGVSQKIPKITDNVESFSEKINKSSTELNALLSSGNREKVETMIADMNAAMSNFSKLSKNLNESQGKLHALLKSVNEYSVEKSITDFRYVVGSIAQHIEAFNQNMEATSRNMYEFSRQIRQNPGLLLGGAPPKDEGAGR
ncbi:MAG: MlaD family protein [Rhodospirillales bacterium]